MYTSPGQRLAYVYTYICVYITRSTFRVRVYTHTCIHHQVNVSAQLAAKNFSYQTPLTLTNFLREPLSCELKLVPGTEATASPVGAPAAGGVFHLFAPDDRFWAWGLGL